MTTVYDVDKITIVHVPAEGQAQIARGQVKERPIDPDARLLEIADLAD